jgi:hypothetical protein
MNLKARGMEFSWLCRASSRFLIAFLLLPGLPKTPSDFATLGLL